MEPSKANHRSHVMREGSGMEALTQTTVGVAMGTGTDVAMESAGITRLKGDLMGTVRARTLSHATMANIRQNLFLSFF
jgi:P-type Cu+ transporter